MLSANIGVQALAGKQAKRTGGKYRHSTASSYGPTGSELSMIPSFFVENVKRARQWGCGSLG